MPRIATYALASALLLTACGGGGEYGYARTYTPLSAEQDHMDAATEVTYEDVRRDPAEYASVSLAWFGVVTGVDVDASTGEGAVHLTYRTLQSRNLCEDERASSCRVTVSERAGGPFSVNLRLSSDQISGQDRVWQGSLLKVYGPPTGEFDDEGGPVLGSSYFRHWPRGTYVTTGAAGRMRR